MKKIQQYTISQMGVINVPKVIRPKEFRVYADRLGVVYSAPKKAAEADAGYR